MKAAERSSAVRCGRSTTSRARHSAIEVDEAEFREDPHQPARERRGPWLRPVATEQRLTGLTARHPHRAQGAVHGGQRLAQVEVPFVYPYSKV